MLENEIEENEIELDDDQLNALQTITAGNKLSLLLASAGRGKSTLVEFAVDELLDRGVNPYRIFFCAPTGKAALVLDNMLSHLGLPIRPATIHRMLGCQGRTWIHDEENRLEADYLFVDEASMVGSELLARIIYSVSEHCCIILVADPEQLLPVSAGCPLIDLAREGGENIATLTTNYRQRQGELVAEVCESILQGKVPDFNQECNVKNAFFNEIDEKEYIAQEVLETIKPWFDAKDDWVCLAPQRKGEAGITALNEFLQQELNPAPEYSDESEQQSYEVKVYGFKIRAGDRVRQIKNNYKLGQNGIFNGDIGTVIEVFSQNVIHVDFNGERVEYDSHAAIKDLVLAYVVTIHSSQGSQYAKVCVIFHTSHYYMLSKSLLYVAVSRAREELHVIGNMKAIKRGVSRNLRDHRNTYLGLKLQDKVGF